MEYLNDKAVLVFFLVLTRVSGMLMVAPLFSAVQVPNNLKIALSITISLVMFPIIYQSVNLDSIPVQFPIFAMIAAKEVLVGLLIGFCAVIITTTVVIAGEYVSLLMGLSIANIVDPVTGQSMPVVGQFYFIVALILFLYVNGHHWLIIGVQTSYSAVPIGIEFPHLKEVIMKLFTLTSQMFLFSLLLILPGLGIMMVTEIALGFTSKVMPQMNIFIVGLPLKIYIGLLFISATMPMARVFIENMYMTLGHYLYKLFV